MENGDKYHKSEKKVRHSFLNLDTKVFILLLNTDIPRAIEDI
jgi:hypothetical protein